MAATNNTQSAANRPSRRQAGTPPLYRINSGAGCMSGFRAMRDLCAVLKTYYPDSPFSGQALKSMVNSSFMGSALCKKYGIETNYAVNLDQPSPLTCLDGNRTPAIHICTKMDKYRTGAWENVKELFGVRFSQPMSASYILALRNGAVLGSGRTCDRFRDVADGEKGIFWNFEFTDAEIRNLVLLIAPRCLKFHRGALNHKVFSKAGDLPVMLDGFMAEYAASLYLGFPIDYKVYDSVRDPGYDIDIPEGLGGSLSGKQIQVKLCNTSEVILFKKDRTKTPDRITVVLKGGEKETRLIHPGNDRDKDIKVLKNVALAGWFKDSDVETIGKIRNFHRPDWKSGSNERVCFGYDKLRPMKDLALPCKGIHPYIVANQSAVSISDEMLLSTMNRFKLWDLGQDEQGEEEASRRRDAVNAKESVSA